MNGDYSKPQFSETESANIAVVRKWFDQVYNKKNSEIIEELLSPDYLFHYEGGTIEGAQKWKDEVATLSRTHKPRHNARQRRCVQ